MIYIIIFLIFIIFNNFTLTTCASTSNDFQNENWFIELQKQLMESPQRVDDINDREQILNANKMSRNVPLISEDYIPWTEKLNSQLVKLWYETSPNTADHSERFYKAWTDLHPEYATIIGPNSLARYATKIICEKHKDPPVEEGMKKKKKKKRFQWTKQLTKELLDIYHRTGPGIKKQGSRIYQEWIKIHPNLSSMRPDYLMRHAKLNIEYPEKSSSSKEIEESNQPKLDHKVSLRRIKWTEDLDSELLDVWKRTSPERNGHSSRIMKEFLAKYPEVKYISFYNLKKRADYLARKKLNYITPWKGKGKELATLKDNQQMSYEEY